MRYFLFAAAVTVALSVCSTMSPSLARERFALLLILEYNFCQVRRRREPSRWRDPHRAARGTDPGRGIAVPRHGQACEGRPRN